MSLMILGTLIRIVVAPFMSALDLKYDERAAAITIFLVVLFMSA
ncbi:hypothetical protein OYT88_05535 [Sporolactobacillus sp. CQH2019]|nr:hypothetical protein [Sporolactobacillus sp. CQH2019]MDD9148009.1 hypothetical protein [Sporolactobacillus sp. CQH2019]